MAITNSQKPDCKNCNKSGLAILPVRYAVVSKTVNAQIPDSMEGNFDSVKLLHHKYVLRTLRQGFIYIYYENNPRNNQPGWDSYSVTPGGTLWKQPSAGSAQSLSTEPSCSRSGHNIPASIIAIDDPERCSPIWIAFSQHAWSQETISLFESDEALRDRRMQKFLPNKWIAGAQYRHGISGTKANIENVIEYKEDFAFSSLIGGLDVATISKPDGSYFSNRLDIETPSHPLTSRKGQSEAVAKNMQKVGQRPDGTASKPVILALWDAVGISLDLNGYRNDAAGWIKKYCSERELEISTANNIKSLKIAIENKAEKNIMVYRQWGMFVWTKEHTKRRLEQFDSWNSDKLQREKQVKLCQQWEQDAIDMIPSGLATRREVSLSLSPPYDVKYSKDIDDEVFRLKNDRDKDGNLAAEKGQARYKESQNAVAAEKWAKYQRKINQPALEKFSRNNVEFLTYTSNLIDLRTDDLLVWLGSQKLLDALTEYSDNSLFDGADFEDLVGSLLLGITSSKKGVEKIDQWIAEGKAVEGNLLWRAFGFNQKDTIAELNAGLAAAASYNNVPFTEQALEMARENIKHIAKFSDLAKKGLGLHNALRKDGVAVVPTAGIEKILMTVGNRFFQPFIKVGVDLLAEKFVQSLLLARAGCEYTSIMTLLAVEAKFGSAARAELLSSFQKRHEISGRKASIAFTTLKNAWQKLVPTADIPKSNKVAALAGGFNEAKDMRFAMTATLLQALLVWKIANDLGDDPNNKKLQAELFATQLSLGAGLVDLGATAIKGLSGAKDMAISFQLLKIFGGILSAFASLIITANDVKAAFISSEKDEVALTYLYAGKATMNALGGLSFSLSTISYINPAMQVLAKRLPNYIVAQNLARGVAVLLRGRALLMLAGVGFNIAVIGVQITIWYFSDDDLEVWCTESVFGITPKIKKIKVGEQEENFNNALKGCV